MTEPAHLTDEQLSRYRDHTLTAVELLDIDGHISACPACRDRLYVAHRTSSAVKALRFELTGHLSYADIVACSEGHGKPHALSHIHECSACQAEVLDLSRFRTELLETPRRPTELPVKPWVKYRMPLGIAAAVLVVAGASTFALRRRPPAEPTHSASAPVQQDPSIPPAERELVQQAMTTGRLERAAVLDNLITARGALLGPAASNKITLLQPIGTTVLTDRPLLRWTPTAGATSYVVAIFDEKFQKLAESPALTGADWQPSAPLPRGQVLNWQVTAKTASGSIHAPRPPEPEARFQIVAPEVADRIEAVRRDFPSNPLLLAVLCARAGALDEAEWALRRLDYGASQALLENLRRMRTVE